MVDTGSESEGGAAEPGRREAGTDRSGLRHPLEGRTTSVVVALAIVMTLTLVGLLLWGAELLERVPVLAQYSAEAKVLLLAVFAGPLVATYARRRRRMLAQRESIRVSATQLPEVHDLLVSHATRAGIPVPELYLSEAIERTTTVIWQQHTCIILCAHELATHMESFDDILNFTLAREVGAICLGYPSTRSELLASLVAPIPFLRAPLRNIRTYSCDRYGAVLAPRALHALLCEATCERLRNRVDPNAYFTQLERARRAGLWASVAPLLNVRLPVTYRIHELRRAGLLTATDPVAGDSPSSGRDRARARSRRRSPSRRAARSTSD